MTRPNKSPDLPTPDTDTDAWWAALREHKLMFNRCRSCGRPSLYVRAFCPHCWSDDIELEQASGHGRLYTWTIVHQAGPPFSNRVPYIPAIVDLAEGIRLMTNIEDCPPVHLRAGLQVRVAFRDREGGFVIPVFCPDV